MTKLILAAVVASAIAGPTYADSADFALRHFAQSEEGGDGARRIAVAPSRGDPAAAYAHFAESRGGGDRGGALVISTSDADLVAAAKAKLDNGERGDN